MIFIRLIKNPSFFIGSLFLFGLFLLSIIYYLYTGDLVPKVDFIKDENGDLLKPPYSPMEYPLLGTDNFGHNIFFLMIVGAKYTIGSALIIATLRVMPSVVIGLFIHFYLIKMKKVLVTIVDASNYFPTTLLAFLLLNWVMYEGPLMNRDNFPFSFQEKVVIYIIILVFISIPSVSLLFANEVDLVMKKEFIQCSKVLGARNVHFIKNHIRPFVVPQIYIVLIREFISVLLLISHLGVLGIFMGGFKIAEDVFTQKKIMSLSHEWSGSLGIWWEFLWTTYPWIAFIPVVFFTLTILAGKMVLIGLTQTLNEEVITRSSIQHENLVHNSNTKFDLINK